ncbi:MAG TPA: hypothetical protein VMF30_12380 [Pirellulales bacterium]|nr:hypothetical protein [Pirellulales bacterium]
MNELLAAAEMPPAACPETPALSAPAVTSAAPAVTLVFGFDGQLIRQEREGDPPKLSKEAIRGILSLWIEYLEVKGIFRLGCQVAPAADSTPIDGKAGPSD